jgi:hypothetical protein
VSVSYPESVGLGAVHEARLPKAHPSLRAGYVTKHGGYALAQASRRLGVVILGGRADGFAGKSAGAVVARLDGVRYWLKVSGLLGHERDLFRDAEDESDRLGGLPKPKIIATADWKDRNIFWRAVLMTLAPSPVASPLPWCRSGSIDVSDAWFSELRSALTKLRHARTRRSIFSPDQVRQMIIEQIGPDAPTESKVWHVGHGDLQWANLTAPQCMLLDWEHWGPLPRGYDIGRLLGCSAFDPALMARLADVFSDEFQSRAGRVGLLAGIASVKGHVALGELDPAAGRALEPVVQRILRMERESRRPLRVLARCFGVGA